MYLEYHRLFTAKYAEEFTLVTCRWIRIFNGQKMETLLGTIFLEVPPRLSHYPILGEIIQYYLLYL
jgi:hypothetical protein